MEIKSFEYIAFALCVIVLYYLFSRVRYAQGVIILCASLFFIFMSCGVRSVVIILLLAAAVYGLGMLIEKQRKKSKKAARIWLLAGIILVIGCLCYFKFFKFTYSLLQSMLERHQIVISDLITPVGMSYYTLSMVAYLSDVYRKKHPAERNFFYFLIFITYFPAIVEGPISLYKKIAPQFKEQHAYKSENFIMGFQRCIWGFFKKAVIADRIGILVAPIISGGYLGPINLICIFLYSFQIYADFSGGIDVIMGISEMLDIRLTENFKSPLVAKSVTEFWQRWHISLGEFMEKYVYYPIVLSKKTRKVSKLIKNKYIQKVFAATLASVAVFVVVGIWHGTGWNYVVYGCYQAFWVSTAVLLAPLYKKVKTALHIDDKSAVWRVFCVIRTFGILMIGRFFTRAQDLHQALSLIHRAFIPSFDGMEPLMKNELGLDSLNVLLMVLCIILLIAVDVAHDRDYHFRERVARQHIAVRYLIYIAGIFAILVLGVYGAGFDTASFIYGGF